MSISYSTVKTSCVTWRSIKLPEMNQVRMSPVFCFEGKNWIFELQCINNIIRVAFQPDVSYRFTLRCLDKSHVYNYKIILYFEKDGKFVRITSTIAIPNGWQSTFVGFTDSTTVLLYLLPDSVSTNQNFEEAEASLVMKKGNDDSDEGSIQTLCLKSLSEDFEKLYNDVESADATLKCADKSFSVHRKILAVRSEVFSAMFKHDLAEKKTGVVNIVDLDSNILEQFLRYLYTGRVEQISVDVALELYQAAEKYSVRTLKQLCASYILDNLSKDIVFDVLILADKAGDVELMDGIASFAVKTEGLLESTEWEEFAEKFPNLAVKVYFKHFKRKT